MYKGLPATECNIESNIQLWGNAKQTDFTPVTIS